MPKKKKNRPRRQPEGWNKAVNAMLKPEHVVRVSDTEVRITLPPCPDYNIEEDETIHVWIPPEALSKAEEPVYAGPFVIKADTYEQRIDNAIQAMKEEKSGVAAAVPTFLIAYFACEIVAKSIVGHLKFRGTSRKSLPKSFTTKDVSDALKDMQIDFSNDSVKLLFATEPLLASEMSARKLRDVIVHTMKPHYRSAVRERYESLMKTMTAFLGAVEVWRESEAPGGGQTAD